MNKTIKQYLETIKFFDKEELTEEIQQLKAKIERIETIGNSYGFTKHEELQWYNVRLTNALNMMNDNNWN